MDDPPIDILRQVSLPAWASFKAIWEDAIVVEAIHAEQMEAVREAFRQLRTHGIRQNLVLEGRPGTGKSHFLGRVRAEVMATGDIFVVAHLSRADEFWSGLVLNYLDALNQENDGTTQLQRLLKALLRRAGIAEAMATSIAGGTVDTELLPILMRYWRRLFGAAPEDQAAASVAQALVLANSADFEHNDIAQSVLIDTPAEDLDRRAYALGSRRLHPREVIRALDRLVQATGRTTVTAIDQLDGLIANAQRTASDGGRSELNGIAIGLMDFAQSAEHTLIGLACTVETWRLVETEAIQSAHHRFPRRERLGEIPSAEAGRELIAKQLADAYARLNYRPAYPTWPIQPAAFDHATDFTPRGLIETVDRHITRCVRQGTVIELASLDQVIGDDDSRPPDPKELEALDGQFERLKAKAPIDDFLARETDAEIGLPALIQAGLEAFVRAQDDPSEWQLDPINPGVKAPIHNRLRRILDPEREDQLHAAFRVIPNAHHGKQQSRLRSAVSDAGLGPGRGLTLIRNTPWNTGQVTRDILAAFAAKGGQTIPLSRAETATLWALGQLEHERPKTLDAWLRSRQPTQTVGLLRTLPEDLAIPPPVDGHHKGRTGGSSPNPDGSQSTANLDEPEHKTPPAPPPEGMIPLGTHPDGAHHRSLPLAELRRHTAIFAGSGSGKTVLLRRIVEECALQGISSIVLDPDNDLARLGTRWPQPPADWGPEDAAKADRYFETVETVVWTPRLNAGRPLAFAPLAGLKDVTEDKDEFAMAVDNAVGLISPHAGLPATGPKREQGRAILTEAIRAYVRDGGERLDGFLAYLNDLPPAVSRLENAPKLAGSMAQTLIAQTVNDPLFGDQGQAVDPSVLLTPAPGRAARVSIVNLAGLPDTVQRQNFVSQLQMVLFSWIKKHPAGDRPLRGLFVMDEAQIFAPSGAMTASTYTTLTLASQARKYGLGLVFATQAPKGIHNHIPGNATIQVFGLMNAATQIQAARELAAAKGGAVPDIAKLRRGEFYIASEGLGFERTDTPLCLSYHPASPLALEEVLALAST
jgi:hypothetical protein